MIGQTALGMLAALLAAVIGGGYALSGWIARIADPKPLPGALGAFERRLGRWCGVDLEADMNWVEYAMALLVFNALGVIATYGLQRLQAVLPLNPQHFAAPSPDSAFNTAVSFVTNTDWQGYSGESTLSYLTQMLALTVQNFLSAATGLSVAFALMRGFARAESRGIGNFWRDVARSTVVFLLPLSALFALILIGQGAIQNLEPYRSVTTLESHTQLVPLGPVASQEAIKMLGTNGGGFFNANSAHPYENPTPLANFLQMASILVIPAGLCFAFGRGVGDRRQGLAIIGAMTVIFIAMSWLVLWAEQQPNPALAALGVDQTHSALQAGGNMEGKETRFGVISSALFAATTTAASCGAVNAMHDSFMPLGGLVPMWLIELGEVVFGGVGAGLYGMLIFAIMAVFVAGLMIGRTPEYLGKKIESFEMKMTAVYILITPSLVLIGTALAVASAAGRAGIANPGAHGFSEILYALSSAANNNGSAFAGLSANTPFYNLLLGVVMWFGRFACIVPVLAIAGSLAAKKRIEPTAGTLPTHGPLFIALLVGTVILVGALTYVPALALGPVIEHLELIGGSVR